MKILTNIFISLFYSGYVKGIPPGTFASIISILILFPILEFDLISYYLFIFFFILILIISLYLIKEFSINTKSHDSSIIVIDEFLGIYLIFIFYEKIFYINNFITICLIFVLFRFFDILKIFPANLIDKNMNNSFGVILDDLVASIYTIICLFLLNVYG